MPPATPDPPHSTPFPPRVALEKSCLFLDIDGTLIEQQPDPLQARFDAGLQTLLAGLQSATGGALALISGRTIASIDEACGALRLPCAGVHGSERRDFAGRHSGPPDGTGLAAITAALQSFVAQHEGLQLEVKPAALALLYRRAPRLESQVRAAIHSLIDRVPEDFALLEGELVMEIKPANFTKASAVDAFLAEPPFAGRTPVYVGDDFSDLDGFSAVRRHGGVDVAVGDRVAARWRLAHPAATRRWLARLLSG